MAAEPQFAEGIDPEQLRPLLNALQSQGWSFDEDKIGIKKTFYFRSYFKAVSFVNVIASQSATKKHHATMTIRFGSVDVHWTTHNPRGLTDKDTSMAQYSDEVAELVGSVEQGQGLKCGPGA
ncbi:4a-hydroxytetrahydrobiopterin dehydratase [Aspergillus lucknowensis]|uniref:4a-hydroxytetrahydrobiopterin dehydratase n=1 Tax=Aspergillus lucknowensis TaxID=176173 RepID=A0ABR4M823_9EURO